MSSKSKSDIEKHQDKQSVKFGYHLIFDAYGCPEETLNNMELCTDTLNSIVKMADMRKFHEPYIVKAESNTAIGGKDPGGFSAFVMIYESHLSLHTFAKRGFVTIDIYSCKTFPVEKVIEKLKIIFKPKDYDVIKLDRGLKYPKDNIY